jgi:hypothetical protein
VLVSQTLDQQGSVDCGHGMLKQSSGGGGLPRMLPSGPPSGPPRVSIGTSIDVLLLISPRGIGPSSGTA